MYTELITTPYCRACESLKRKRDVSESSDEEEAGLLWNWDWQPDSTQFAQLSGAEASMYQGPRKEVRAYQHCQVREMRLRTAYTERTLLTQESAVAYSYPGQDTQYGLIQNIWEVAVGEALRVLVDIEFSKHSSPDSSFAAELRVSSARVPGDATRREVVDPRFIRGQVFFAEDPSDTNHLHVFSLTTSATQSVVLTESSEAILQF
jgi:hypothetical protein